MKDILAIIGLALTLLAAASTFGIGNFSVTFGSDTLACTKMERK